jgi:signal transduction histidine kinase/ActR/RegA family two-component response regulator
MSTTGTKDLGRVPPTIDELRAELARERAEMQQTRERASELTERNRQLQSLYLLTDRLQRAATLDDIYSAALDAILSGLRCDRASILLYDDSQVMRFVAWRGLSDDYRRAAEGHSPWKPDDREPTPIGFGNIEDVELEPQLKARIRLEGIRAAAFIPLVADGRIIGKFMTYFDSLHEFRDEEMSLSINIARQLAAALQRHRSLQALFDAQRQLALAGRRKDEFIAMLAHELRNPLAPITNAIALLARERSTSQLQQEAHALIERQTGRLTRLVDDLLDVSRITSGRVQLKRAHVTLESIVERAIETARPLLERESHRLSVHPAADTIWLYADSTRLEQVLVNLLSNAAKYTPPGGEIRVETHLEDETAVLSVSDNGIGIDAELLPQIFELFTQSERSLDRSRGGLGVGLSVVDGLVKMHGGKVEVTSQVGTGSRFIVRLPAVPAPAIATPGVVPPPRREPKQSAAAHRLRILIVDDNVDAADSLSLLLGMSGHRIAVSHDGEAALEHAAALVPDVIFLDIGLPGLDGYEVARRLRQLPPLAGTLIVAMTGYGQPDDLKRSLEAGFDRHLVKPVDPAAIEHLLDQVGKPARA